MGEETEWQERRHGELDKRLRDVEQSLSGIRSPAIWLRWTVGLTASLIIVLQFISMLWMQAISTRQLDMRDDIRADKKDDVDKIIALAVWKSGIERDLREIKKAVKPDA